MLKKTIKYKDLDGNPIVEDFYFNFTKAEIVEWRASAIKNGEDTFEDLIERVKSAKDGALVIGTFKEIVTRAIGRRSEDGKRFIKDQEAVDAFMQSEAYSEFMMELFTDPKFGAAFINSIMPADMVAAAAQGKTLFELPNDDVKVPAPKLSVDTAESVKKLGDYTQAELMALPSHEFEELMKQSRGAL